MEAENPRAVMGANNPPDPIKERVDALVSTANRWLSERPELTDQEMADKCSAFLDQIRAAAKDVEAQRKDEKQPHLDAAKAVDAKFKPLSDLLDKAASLLKPKLTAWLQHLQREKDEAARLAREEAQRKAEEAQRAAEEAARATDVVGASVAAEEAQRAAEEAARAAVRAEKAPVNLSSAIGARTKSLRTMWRARVTAPAKAIWHYREHPEVLAVVERLSNADARANAADLKGVSNIPGVEFYSEQSAA